MNFGEAIQVLKTGYCVSRAGWNGKNMALMHHDPPESETCTLPYIIMRTADGNFVPWLASQTDILAEDWEQVS